MADVDEDDVRARMHAERGPEINTRVLHRNVLEAVDGKRRARRRRSLHGLLVTAAIAVAATIAVPGHNVPSFVAGRFTTGMLTCGKVPEPSGPRSRLLDLDLSGPSTGQSAMRVSLKATFRSKTGAEADYNLDQETVYVVRDGYIIGKYPDDGGYAGVGRDVHVEGNATRTFEIEGTVLAGCPRGVTDLMNPNGSRPPLPAGTYQLVTVIPDVVDSGQEGSQLVSTPMTINVTAATDERAR